MAREPRSYIGLNYDEITKAFIQSNHTGNDPSLSTLETIDRKWRGVGQEIQAKGLGSKY